MEPTVIPAICPGFKPLVPMDVCIGVVDEVEYGTSSQSQFRLRMMAKSGKRVHLGTYLLELAMVNCHRSQSEQSCFES
jgi:hypothetical protein